MPVVSRTGPYVFFYSLENNEPAHTHIRRDSSLAKFWLDTVSLSYVEDIPTTSSRTFVDWLKNTANISSGVGMITLKAPRIEFDGNAVDVITDEYMLRVRLADGRENRCTSGIFPATP